MESFVLLKNTLKKVFKRNLLSLQGRGIEALNWSLVSVSNNAPGKFYTQLAAEVGLAWAAPR